MTSKETYHRVTGKSDARFACTHHVQKNKSDLARSFLTDYVCNNYGAIRAILQVIKETNIEALESKTAHQTQVALVDVEEQDGEVQLSNKSAKTLIGVKINIHFLTVTPFRFI